MSQVFLPILEDIDIAIENQNRKIQKSERTFLLNTILLMIDKFNRFIDRNIKRMSSVIPCYIDIVLMFLSQTKSARIIEVLVRCIRPFIASIAPQLGKSDWDDVTESLKLCFQATSPSDMLEQAKQVMIESDDQTVLKLEKLFSRTQVQAFLVDLSDDLLTKCYSSLSVTNIAKLILCLRTAN